MKYYNENDGKLYDTVEALEAAEKKRKEAEEAKKIKADQKEARKEEVKEAYQKYQSLLVAYIKDYKPVDVSLENFRDIPKFDPSIFSRIFW